MPAMSLTNAARMLDAYMNADVPAFLSGPPGVGKSDIVAQSTAARGVTLIDQRVTLLDPVDLRGLPHIVDGAAVWGSPGFLPNATRDGPQGVLFLDELNAAPPSTQAACYQLVLNRKLGEYTLPPGWRIVAAGNRQSDRAAAQRMPSALANRFAHIDVEPDPDSWCQWANGAGVEAVGVAFIRFRPNLLHVMPGAETEIDQGKLSMPSDARAFPTPRSWTSAFKLAMAPADLRMPLIAGLVGEGPAAEFEGFIRTFTEIPSIRDILADPAGARVPNGPAACFAVATAIARKAAGNTFSTIMDYAKRLPREFEILTAIDATRRDKALKETPAYVSWCSRNADVVM